MYGGTSDHEQTDGLKSARPHRIYNHSKNNTMDSMSSADTASCSSDTQHPSAQELSAMDSQTNEPQHVILFYKYHPLSSCRKVMEIYRRACERLCLSLHLLGRILVGCSDQGEGINGTLSGSYRQVKVFTLALLKKKHDNDCSLQEKELRMLQEFWEANEQFAKTVNIAPLYMESPDEFKWSCVNNPKQRPLFPDLNIKLVKELVSTGGVFDSISVAETSKGYLTPKEWHNELIKSQSSKDTIVIDCRNTKECSIGRFEGALDPKTTTFSQFPNWVQQNKRLLQDKRVLMSCTGGIRCEKASAYIRNTVEGVKDVLHLKGGVHKYLEEFGSEGLWRGKNFVFDGRWAAGAHETKLGKDGTRQKQQQQPNDASAINDKDDDDIVGRCLYCASPHDVFDPGCVCTVCREPVLVCDSCRASAPEYHCSNHFYLKSCYFTHLERYTDKELKQQHDELERHLMAISVGRRFKRKRKTLQKQMTKIQQHLGSDTSITSKTNCRSCGDDGCSGSCWGFHSLKRKEILEEQNVNTTNVTKIKRQPPSRQSSNHRVSKQLKRAHDVEEIRRLRLSVPPSGHRHFDTGIRVPPPCLRILQTSVKGKWCSKPARQVVQQEFEELSNDAVLEEALEKGLLQVNGEPLTISTATTRELKNMDVLSRIVHWHEPPVIVPPKIQVTKVSLPWEVRQGYQIDETNAVIYVCDKPSSVPVHPAGPYLSNTLTLMVEGQEKGLEPRSLISCHRIDRVTSGLTMCCTNVGVARLIQSKIDEGVVMKLYLAAIEGCFPQSEEDLPLQKNNPEYAQCSWRNDVGSCIQVDAPIDVQDAKNGIRTISKGGKPSCSRFQCVAYDSNTDTSLVVCCPLTGRGHQLRVHLQWLGFPICNDVQYGARSTSTTKRISKDAILDQMVRSNNDANNNKGVGIAICKEQAESAKEACRCCRDGKAGIESSFTDAQLLQGGHSIHLHALRYRIPVARKQKGNKKKADNENDQEPLAVLNMQVEAPEWAKAYGDILSTVSWLQNKTKINS